MMRIIVDHEQCQGHAQCAANAPDLFTLNDEGYNVTPPKDVPKRIEDQARRAAASCPERAIQIEE